MRFFVDALSNDAVEQLRDKGHDVEKVKDAWKEDPGDKKIVEYANENDRVIITCDNDFGTLAIKDRMQTSGVIIYDQSMNNMQVADRIDAVSTTHADALQSGAVIKIDENNTRVRDAASFPSSSEPPEPTKSGISQPPPSTSKQPEPDWKAKWRQHSEDVKIPEPPPPPPADTQSQSKGRSR